MYASDCEICYQAGVLAGILGQGELYSQDALATCLFHLEGLLKENSGWSQSVLAHELAARIAPAFGVPFPVVSELAINAAVAAEREACAKVAEDLHCPCEHVEYACECGGKDGHIAKAIRARGAAGKE